MDIKFSLSFNSSLYRLVVTAGVHNDGEGYKYQKGYKYQIPSSK